MEIDQVFVGGIIAFFGILFFMVCAISGYIKDDEACSPEIGCHNCDSNKFNSYSPVCAECKEKGNHINWMPEQD